MRIVVATTDVFVRRLTPALTSFVRHERDFRIVDVRRPFAELRKAIRDLRPAGLITESLPGITRNLVKLGYPTVIADSDEIIGQAASLDVDDRAIGEVAARFFRDSGYRSFACLHLSTPYGWQRWEGFRDFLRGRGEERVESLLAETRSDQYMESWDRPPAKLSAWLRGLPKPVGIFAVHDPLGRLLCEEARDAGWQVPEEVAVLGANDDELVCGLSHPPLSSVAIPWNKVGALAGEWIQALIEGKPAPREPILVQPGPVVTRRSTTLLAVDDPELRRALQYLRDHATQPISVQTMCRELRLSRRSVERKFAAQLAATPWETLCRMRVDLAKTMLIDTDLPMGFIAERCGFGDPERFSVVFRRLTRSSPSQFRKAARGRRP